MGYLGLPFSIAVNHEKTATDTREDQGIIDFVIHNALIKIKHDPDMLQDKNVVIIGCDSAILSCDDQLILKPIDLSEAKEMLKQLMHEPHSIFSGIAVWDISTGRINTRHDKTKVYLQTLSDDEMDHYVSIINPLDHLGGYAKTGKGAMLVEKIEGSYFNLLGLPLNKLMGLLKECGINILGS